MALGGKQPLGLDTPHRRRDVAHPRLRPCALLNASYRTASSHCAVTACRLGADEGNRVIYDGFHRDTHHRLLRTLRSGGQHPAARKTTQSLPKQATLTNRSNNGATFGISGLPLLVGGSSSADSARSHTFLNPTVMEWKDRIAQLFRRKPEWEREHRRTLITRHAEKICSGNGI